MKISQYMYEKILRQPHIDVQVPRRGIFYLYHDNKAVDISTGECVDIQDISPECLYPTQELATVAEEYIFDEVGQTGFFFPDPNYLSLVRDVITLHQLPRICVNDADIYKTQEDATQAFLSWKVEEYRE